MVINGCCVVVVVLFIIGLIDYDGRVVDICVVDKHCVDILLGYGLWNNVVCVDDCGHDDVVVCVDVFVFYCCV